MIRGKSIRLRTVRATDLDQLYALLTDIAIAGTTSPSISLQKPRSNGSSTRQGSGVQTTDGS